MAANDKTADAGPTTDAPDAPIVDLNKKPKPTPDEVKGAQDQAKDAGKPTAAKADDRLIVRCTLKEGEDAQPVREKAQMELVDKAKNAGHTSFSIEFRQLTASEFELEAKPIGTFPDGSSGQ